MMHRTSGHVCSLRHAWPGQFQANAAGPSSGLLSESTGN